MSETVKLSPELERQLLDAAITKIRGLIEECVQGVSDREAEALTLAADWEQLRGWVTDGFAKARPKKPDAEGANLGCRGKAAEPDGGAGAGEAEVGSCGGARRGGGEEGEGEGRGLF